MAVAKKKKRFFEVEMPVIGKTTQLYAFAVEDLNKRIIRYDLTRALKGKSILLDLDVQATKEKATSTPRELKLMPYFIKRMIKNRTNYVEDSFSIECKDAKLRIKPFLITRRKVSRLIRKALREKCKEEIIAYCNKKTYETIFEDILKNKLQKELSLKLKKVYPLSLCEIRSLKVEKILTSEKAESKKAEKKTKEEDKTE